MQMNLYSNEVSETSAIHDAPTSRYSLGEREDYSLSRHAVVISRKTIGNPLMVVSVEASIMKSTGRPTHLADDLIGDLP